MKTFCSFLLLMKRKDFRYCAMNFQLLREIAKQVRSFFLYPLPFHTSYSEFPTIGNGRRHGKGKQQKVFTLMKSKQKHWVNKNCLVGNGENFSSSCFIKFMIKEEEHSSQKRMVNGFIFLPYFFLLFFFGETTLLELSHLQKKKYVQICNSPLFISAH